jgi:hypothetical protein
MNQRASATTPYTFALRLANPMAFVLIVLPILDIMFGVFPAQPNQLSWRVATIGLISGALLQPMIGFLLALTAAHALERRTLYRILALICALTGVALLLAAVLFAFDAIQLRGLITAETKRAYDFATVKSLFVQVVQAAVFLAMTFTSMKLGRSTARREAEQRRMAADTAPIVTT